MKKLILSSLLGLSFFSVSAVRADTDSDADATEVAPEKKSASPHLLSDEDKEILQKGELSTARYVTGGVIGTAIGLGIGHAIEHNYGHHGWIFSAGEGLGYVVAIVAIGGCVTRTYHYGSYDNYSNCSDASKAWYAAGLTVALGLHIWEIVEVWTLPPEQNRRYRQLRARQRDNALIDPSFMIMPNADHGVAMGFQAKF